MRTVVCGSLPRLRMGTNPAETWCATAPPRMKPRASIPATLSILLPAHGCTNSSTARRKARASPSSVVLWRNRIPGFGRSGMGRMAAFRSLSKVIDVTSMFSPCATPASNKRHSVAASAERGDACSIDPAKPECVLDDTQPYLAAERHQRFRMKLHATHRQSLVLDRHGDAVLGACGDRQHIGHAVALDVERVVAADYDLVRQVLHQPAAPHLHLRRPSMRRLPKLAELATEIFADRLHAETDAEHRQLVIEGCSYCFGDAEVLRPPRTRRQHQQVPLLLLEHVERVDVSDHRHVGPDLAEIIRQHMDKTIVVIDQQDLLARARSIGRKGG